MPISFHLTVSRSAAHAGETNRRSALRIRQRRHRAKPMSVAAGATKPRILLPPSPREELLPTPPPTVEVATPRPTLDLVAPEGDWPWREAPDDVDYDEFGGKSPGFCLTGACRCGRCGGDRYGSNGSDRYWRSSRYSYDDYARDYYGEEDEGDYYAPVETYAEAKIRICDVLSRYIRVIEEVTGRSSKETLLLEMLRFLLDEPYTQEFMDKNAKFKTVLGPKLSEWGLVAERLDVKAACGAVIGRFF